MSRQQVIEELRSRGYDGPVSFTKGRLEEMLAEFPALGEEEDVSLTELQADIVQDFFNELDEAEDVGAGDPPPAPEPKLGPKPRGKNRATPSPDPYVREPVFETLTPDFDFQVRQDRGWYHFLNRVTNPDTGEWWLEAFGGEGKHKQFRCFRPERLKRRAHNGAIVQRKSRYGKNEEEES